MKICIIAEGSYPYTVGGVSSWTQMLINSMPEHQFVICAIGAEEKDRGRFKYKLPANVTEVKEVFLDAFLRDQGEWGQRYHLEPPLREALKSLLMGEPTDWGEVFAFFISRHKGSISDFLMSKDFYDLLEEVYQQKFPQTPFNDLFWTMRCMLLPLLLMVRIGIPEADLYHSVATGYAGVIGSLGKIIYKKPFIMTEHGIYTREREEEIIKSDWVQSHFKDAWIEFFYNLSRCAYTYADQVITLFNQNKKIEIELGCREEKIRIIPNGIDIRAYQDIKQKDPTDPFINIGAVLRVVPIKDVKTMILSFALAKEQNPTLKLYIMGPYEEDQVYYEECKKLVESLQVKDIVFTGNIKVKEYIGIMDILLLTSISEGQPLALLEGMACRKPLITTDVGSCRELLFGIDDDFGPAGVVLPVMDYEKIGQEILRLSQDEPLRVEMGRNGFNRIASLYTLERFISGYKKIYQAYEGKY
jgi:glycosyltransferase involved in cell wall biosynthesis